MSELINGYELTEPFQNHNAGFSRWTYAKRKGKTYFLKEFMNPIFPDEESLSPELRKKRVADCTEFEEKKKKLYDAINQASDGNAVKVFEFFRCDSHYYISNRKVIGEQLAFAEISKLPLEDRVLLCRTAAHSVMKLHEAHIVHSDIKDTNVLIQKTVTGKLSAKLIDFDCSFFEADPPESENDLGGDQVYLAPEACQFICGDPIKLTCKIDVFALGLLFHEYLTGELPGFDHTEYDYAHEAVLDDQELAVSETLPYQLRRIIQQMLVCDPQRRCSMIDVFNSLGEFIADSAPFEINEVYGLMESDQDPPTQTPQGFFYTAGDL